MATITLSEEEAKDLRLALLSSIADLRQIFEFDKVHGRATVQWLLDQCARQEVLLERLFHGC